MIPDWKTHCPHAIDAPNKVILRGWVKFLFDLNTCFVVETSELRLFTTERGAKALSAHLTPTSLVE